MIRLLRSARLAGIHESKPMTGGAGLMEAKKPGTGFRSAWNEIKYENASPRPHWPQIRDCFAALAMTFTMMFCEGWIDEAISNDEARSLRTLPIPSKKS